MADTTAPAYEDVSTTPVVYFDLVVCNAYLTELLR